MPKLTSQRGFTLIELLVTIALIAIIAVIAVPQFGNMIERNRVVSKTNSIVGLLNFARGEAIRRNVLVEVDFSADPISAQLQDGTVIRAIETMESGTTVVTSIAANEVVFRSNGMAGNQEIVIRVCSGDAEGREIVVDPGGRLNSRIPVTACS
ncbi:GspH/FimT family pseudopilin [Marinobacter litoralis]|uniref:GspH/FimT family pseudopilin n=1 Tax=Marinobacter litoralis TaxID=187981 RepID=UPI0018EC3314|nr:GspH/FimT family pseudopilin [Marinobacter litoralis]MBJ6138657.1 GspH/FimT family pseudopilin [Marinobacter litoralis]